MTEQEIHSICKKYEIKDYTINMDGSIDVHNSVYLNGRNLLVVLMGILIFYLVKININ